MSFKAIAFDLDDTLIDTTNELIPFACRKIHTYLLSQGYSGRFDEFDGLRKDFVKTKSHKEFFKSLVPKLPNAPDKEKFLPTLNRYFYEPEIPKNLMMMPGAESNLGQLSSKYQIFVVTAGVMSAQERKLSQLKISRYIKPENVLIVAEGGFVTKKTAFEKILMTLKIQPEELLSVGNRLSQEIRMAKQLNCRTCYFQFGEDRGEVDQEFYKKINYRVTNHFDLIETCEL